MEQQLPAASPATLVLGNADLLDDILRHCSGYHDRQQALWTLSQVCRGLRDACDEVLHRSTVVKLVQDVRLTNFRSALAGLRGWARRFMGRATAVQLGVWCWNAQDQLHLHNTLLFNKIAVQAAGPGLRSLQLRLPHLLAHLADQVLVSPRLEGLTELRLQLSPWEQAEGTVEAERLLGRDPCPAAEVMVRIIRPLTALQSLELLLTAADESSPFDWAQLLPSLPPSLTRLALVGKCPPLGHTGHTVPAALADLAHLRCLQHLRLCHVLSAKLDRAPLAALAPFLTYLELAQDWDCELPESLLSGGIVLPALRGLHLRGCQLGTIALEAAAPALQYLCLSHCQLGRCPRFSQLTALTRLVLDSPESYGEPVPGSHLQGLTALRSLYLRHCALRQGAGALPLLPQLTALQLRRCAVRAPLHVSGLPQLRDLRVFAYWWDWEEHQMIEGLEELSRLTRLSLPPGFPRLRPAQRAALAALVVLEPASLAPPGWRPPQAAPAEPAAGGAAEADSDGDSVDSFESYHDSDPYSEPDSEDEQWEALTRQSRFYYF